MTIRAALRLLLLAAMLIAPLGRMGAAQAMTGHCADMPAAASHHDGNHKPETPPPAPDREAMAIDCMIACAAVATAPALLIAPAPPALAVPDAPTLSSPAGIRPEAATPPPRTA